jgi:hypothetical protein
MDMLRGSGEEDGVVSSRISSSVRELCSVLVFLFGVVVGVLADMVLL